MNVSRCCLVRAALPVVELQRMEVLHVVYASTFVRAGHVLLLRSLSSVPLTFLAISRYRASSICFVQTLRLFVTPLCSVQIDSLLVHLVFSGACYKEMRWLGMHKQAGTRAGNHQRHTQQTPAHQHRPTMLHEP